ncbi:hypothetical protein Q9966_000117 [Columba livia]|nr:hypothetical protein Q9966_000117 [Columba livia]
MGHPETCRFRDQKLFARGKARPLEQRCSFAGLYCHKVLATVLRCLVTYWGNNCLAISCDHGGVSRGKEPYLGTAGDCVCATAPTRTQASVTLLSGAVPNSLKTATDLSPDSECALGRDSGFTRVTYQTQARNTAAVEAVRKPGEVSALHRKAQRLHNLNLYREFVNLLKLQRAGVP